jgi:recA bacterial DNA recombination protein
MSSAVFSTSAAQGRPLVFDDEDVAAVCPQPLQPTGAELFGEARPPQRVVLANSAGAFRDAKLASVTPASRLAVRPTPEMVSSGIAAMDALTGGLPRGCLTEICGPASSGRTTLLLSALAASTQRGEFCAVVDAGDALDPHSAAAAGIELDRMLWVRCGENSNRAVHCWAEQRRVERDRAEHDIEQLLRATDLLLESGGFGMIALDLGDLPPQAARRIPLTTWFRFRRAVEHTPTVLLAIERQSIAGSCSSLLIKLAAQAHWMKQLVDSQSPAPTHAQLLTELEITAEIVRSRMDRKPARSAEITFASKTAWAG